MTFPTPEARSEAGSSSLIPYNDHCLKLVNPPEEVSYIHLTDIPKSTYVATGWNSRKVFDIRGR